MTAIPPGVRGEFLPPSPSALFNGGKSFHHDREKAPFQGEVSLFNPIKYRKTDRVRRWPHTGRRKVDKGGIVSTIGRRKTPGMGVNPSTIYAAACCSLHIGNRTCHKLAQSSAKPGLWEAGRASQPGAGEFLPPFRGNPSTMDGENLPRFPISFHDRAGNSSTIGEEILPP
jgi:hypothetical protein